MADEIQRTGAGSFRLNLEKTRTLSYRTVADSELKLLGAYIGSVAKRQEFLEAKITHVSKSIRSLTELQNQHALLLLGLSLQQKLRHLTRCIEASGVEELSDDMDYAILTGAMRIRGDSTQITGEDNKDRHLWGLPVRLGGCGFTPYFYTYPIARQSMS